MASNRSNSAGISRAALKSGSPRPSARREEPAPRAALPVVVVQPPSALGEFLQIVGGVAIVVGGLAVLLTALHLIRDSMSVGKHLAEARNQRSTLVCKDGRMVRGDGSLRDILLEDAYFVCTDWRTLQSVEIEESKGR